MKFIETPVETERCIEAHDPEKLVKKVLSPLDVFSHKFVY